MMPFPLILSSPSGGGKTTIAQKLLTARSDVGYSVSCTTRPPARRRSRRNATTISCSVEDFKRGQEAGDFAESAEVHGHLYGTLRRGSGPGSGIRQARVMDIDVQGARQFAEAYPDSVLIFILPPSAKALITTARGKGDGRARNR